MQTIPKLPTQKKYAVAFVDVLGISNKIEKDSEWALFWVWFLYNSTLSVWGNHERIKIKIFSDNILICEEISPTNPNVAIMEVLSVVDTLEKSVFNTGALFLRGAVVVDDFYFSDNFVYGKALLQAYTMESTSVIYPRIVVDQSVFNFIDKEKLLVKLDSDGLYFYDFLQSRINNGGNRLSQQLETLQANIIINVKSNLNVESVMTKMKWLISYFNKACLANGINRTLSLDNIL